MNYSYKKVGIIGAGCYGTAIAQCFSLQTKNVLLLSNSEEISNNINERHINSLLDGIILNKNIFCTINYSDLKDCDIVFIAVPVSAVDGVCISIRENKINAPVILCSKGVDVEKGRLISERVEEYIDNDIAIFSGPSFAHEIANGLPFGVNIAAKNKELSAELSRNLSHSRFVIKPLEDYIGLQIAGAFKNILAIGCGITNGMKLGNNAIAQFIVNGLSEMMDLSIAMGGKKETLFELGGIGDIILTCTSKKSRNVLFGEYIANGGRIETWTGNLAEGAFAAKSIPLFKKKYGVQLKIFSEIYASIYQS